MEELDPRAVKLLGDLLALAASDDSAQAQAALAALRRRAAADGVTGGALKHLVAQIARLRGTGGPRPEELDLLRWRLDDQRRELEETRTARQRAEIALERSEQAQAQLSESVAEAYRRRRTGWLGGFLLGIGLAVIGAAFLRLTGAGRLTPHAMDRVARAQVADYLLGCFLASSNSLVGTPFNVHLLITVDADGRIVAARLAPVQIEQFSDPDHRMYGEMVIRTLASGSCGALPLPASLRGRPGQLDLYIRR